MAKRIIKALEGDKSIESKGEYTGSYRGFVADIYKWVKENYGIDAGKRLDYFDKTAREWFDNGVTIEEAKDYIMENFKGIESNDNNLLETVNKKLKYFADNDNKYYTDDTIGEFVTKENPSEIEIKEINEYLDRNFKIESTDKNIVAYKFKENIDDAIMLDVVADTIVENVARYAQKNFNMPNDVVEKIYDKQEEISNKLVEHMNVAFKNNEKINKALSSDKGNVALDTAYKWMEHWSARYIKESVPEAQSYLLEMSNKGLFWDRQYEIIDLNMKNLNLSDVSMPPQKGETLASNKIKIDDVIQERMDLDKVNKDDEQSDWQYYATVLNVGNETIQLYNKDTDKKWRVLPEDLYEDIDTGVLRISSSNKVKSTKTKANEEEKYLTPGGRNGLADVMAELIFGGDYKSAYESLVRQMSDDDFLSAYNYIKRMNYSGEEEFEKELEEAEKEYFQE
jgi:hypothetical protein